MSESCVTWDIQAWLAGKHHARLHDCVVAWIKPWRLMPFKANSMARMMKEVLFQAKLLHCDFCCLVYSPTFYSRSEGLESRGLRLQHRREVLLGDAGGANLGSQDLRTWSRMSEIGRAHV